MNYFRYAISKLYNVVSSPVAATSDTLAERLQSVRNTVTSFYNRTKEKLGYGETPTTLHDIVQEEANKTTLDSKTSSTCMDETRRPLMMELKICNTYLMVMICG